MYKHRSKIIGVDFDGTLAVTKGTFPDIQEPIQEVIDYVLREQRKGAFLILITMREGEALEKAVSWCRDQGIEFDTVNDNLPHMKAFYKNNPRKIFCNEYLDDTNMGGIDYILQEIKRKRDSNDFN